MQPPKKMFLGVWGKLLVIAIGAAVVVLVVLIVVCFVGPGCWGYQYLHKEEEEKKKRLEFGDRQEGKKVENVDLADLSSYSKRKKSNLVYDSARVEKKGVSFLNSFRVIFISTEDPLIPSVPLQLPNLPLNPVTISSSSICQLIETSFFLKLIAVPLMNGRRSRNIKLRLALSWDDYLITETPLTAPCLRTLKEGLYLSEVFPDDWRQFGGSTRQVETRIDHDPELCRNGFSLMTGVSLAARQDESRQE
uniref:Uncharacterized protein n=1 Tax=Timema tahoe TaxID=61484 RepID=A0A7R9NZI2_9NEOP|nr:unnamed protein product [Timema tahoe]